MTPQQKIQHLLDLANDPSTTEDERRSAALAAAKMMKKHGTTMQSSDNAVPTTAQPTQYKQQPSYEDLERLGQERLARMRKLEIERMERAMRKVEAERKAEQERIEQIRMANQKLDWQREYVIDKRREMIGLAVVMAAVIIIASLVILAINC
jgi:hypothetical protein